MMMDAAGALRAGVTKSGAGFTNARSFRPLLVLSHKYTVLAQLCA